MTCSVQCSMCSMKCTGADSGAFAVAGAVHIHPVQCSGSQCAACQHEDFAVETG